MMIDPSGMSQSCYDPKNPCATCVCKKGPPSKLVRDEDGCQKPKLCPNFCPSWKDEEHRVGDNWDCWHDDYKYSLFSKTFIQIKQIKHSFLDAS